MEEIQARLGSLPRWLKMGWERIVLLFCIAAAAAGCVSQQPNKYNLAFVYKGFGVGPTPNSHTVVLEEGQEATAVRRAVITALQTRKAAPVEEAEHRIHSDVVQLDAQEIDTYNAAQPAKFRLRNDRQYGMEYVIDFKLDRSSIDLNISAQLNERGVNNPWKRMSKASQYDSVYFTKPFSDDVHVALLTASEQRSNSR